VTTTFATLTSCDPSSSFEYKIENASSRQLILIHPAFGSGQITLNPGDTKIATRGQMGSYKYLKNDYYKDESYCPCSADSSKIFVADTNFKLTKKITDCNSWSRSDKKKKFLNKGGDFKCTFIVTDQDIQ
jgi:hypothetical protein